VRRPVGSLFIAAPLLCLAAACSALVGGTAVPVPADGGQAATNGTDGAKAPDVSVDSNEASTPLDTGLVDGPGPTDSAGDGSGRSESSTGVDSGVAPDSSPDSSSNRPDSAIPPVCTAMSGQACTTSMGCCSGLACGTSGTCVCQNQGDPCTADESCCGTLLCDGTSKTCALPPQCTAQQGQACVTSTDCCSSLVCGTSGICACQNQGESCTKDDNCCGTLLCDTNDNLCQALCSGPGETCTTDAQCCSSPKGAGNNPACTFGACASPSVIDGGPEQ
jgi:hypothetical protein